MKLPSARGCVRSAALTAVLGLLATMLEGCDLFSIPSNPAENLVGVIGGNAPGHPVGNWRMKSNYLIQYQVIPPGAGDCGGVLNSCSVESMDSQIQCSGRGVCRPAYPRRLDNPIYFCQCDPGWADPECRTPRKSQLRAFVLSVFLGVFGFDQYYLGFTFQALIKCITLGGFGIWWIVDIVRIGSGRIYAKNFRVADDLPKWGFVTLAVITMSMFGFAVATCTLHGHITKKRREWDKRKHMMGRDGYTVGKVV